MQTDKNLINKNFSVIIVQVVFCVLVLTVILVVKLLGGFLNEDFTKWYNDNIRDETNINEVLEANTYGDGTIILENLQTDNSDFIVPLDTDGVITSNYGYRLDPINGEYKMHEGLDIAAQKGSGILCTCDGKVYKTGYEDGYGNFIILEHSNGLKTLYAHCDTVVAKVGDLVQQGEIIATVGSTGRSTGNHLHFEIRKEDLKVNPLWIIG